MSNELVRTQLEGSLQVKSLKDLVKLGEVTMLAIDTSGSMEMTMVNGRRRIDGLREVVTAARSEDPVPMISFGNEGTHFVDHVPEPGGGTPMHEAIRLAKQHGANRLVIISDGEPDLRDHTLDEARNFGGRIDVVFVGDPGSMGSFFLEELAKATGGSRVEGDLVKTKELSGTVIGLLMGEVEETRGPIQGPGFTADEADIDEPEEDDDEDFEDEDDDEEDDDEDSDDDDE